MHIVKKYGINGKDGTVVKKRFVALIAMALAVGLLGGCGSKMTASTDAGESTKTKTEKKDETPKEFDNSDGPKVLSEALGSGRWIGYVMSNMDKAETPSDIYFFENEKLTVIPGDEFGLTLGEFSKMDNADIWDKLDQAKEQYKEDYAKDMERKIGNAAIAKFWNTDGIDDDTGAEYSFLQIADKVLTEAKGKTYKELQGISYDSVVQDPDGEFEFSPDMGMPENLQQAAEGCVFSYLKWARKWDDYPKDETSWIGGDNEISPSYKIPGKLLDDAIAYANKTVGEIKKLADDMREKGPFFDLTCKCAITTDETGNYVQEEALVYPTRYEGIDEIPRESYDELTFGNAEGADIQIYDTTYNCMPLSSGKIFCTTASITLDTADTENETVLLDPTDDDLDAMYRDEVNARYN